LLNCLKLTMYLQHDDTATVHNTEEGKQLEVWKALTAVSFGSGIAFGLKLL